MLFLNLYTKSPYNSGLQIPCCISFFQTDVIFFDKFKVSTIKFGKRLAEFMIPSCLRSLVVKNLLRLLESLTCGYARAKRIS